MGGGTYSSTAKFSRDTSNDLWSKSTQEVFSQRNINSAMNPFGIKIRESRDSVDHPESFPIIIALDVTGSMGSIPHYLVKEGLPNIMDKIIQAGIKDPQVLFLGIGDHTCDNAPLQVGQFESSDELLDHWLTTVWLEGRGGGNNGESYHLAWYFGGYHTSTDSFEKRGKKGVLITIGDEPVLKTLPEEFLKRTMGPGQYENFSTEKLLAKAAETWECYHINVCETYSGGRKDVQNDWKQLIKENLILSESKENISTAIAEVVIKHGKAESSIPIIKPQFVENTESVIVQEAEEML